MLNQLRLVSLTVALGALLLSLVLGLYLIWARSDPKGVAFNSFISSGLICICSSFASFLLRFHTVALKDPVRDFPTELERLAMTGFTPVFSGPPAEAELTRIYLVEHGIRAQVLGDVLASQGGNFGEGDVLSMQVTVSNIEAVRAKELLAQREAARHSE